MKKNYIYRAECGKDLLLNRGGNGREPKLTEAEQFSLEGPCDRLKAGTVLPSVIEYCKNCSMKKPAVLGDRASGIRAEMEMLPEPVAPPPDASDALLYEAGALGGGIPEKAASPIPLLTLSPPPPPHEMPAPIPAPVAFVPIETIVESPIHLPTPIPEPALSLPPQSLPSLPPPLFGQGTQTYAPGPVDAEFISTTSCGPIVTTEAMNLKQLSNSLLTDIIQSGEESIDLNEALKPLGLEGGPSVGGLSIHTLLNAMTCWRKAYYKHCAGLRKKQQSTALLFGQLYHACFELWYQKGGQMPYDAPCDAVRQAGAPKLAGDVQRLVYMELKHFSKEEAETWDVRAIEQNALYHLPATKIGGKLVRVPLTCRHDMLLAKRSPGAACHPAGPVPTGVYVLDRKTARALTYDITKGYGMDPQFLMNALIYLRSGEVETFGPLVGIIVAVAIKHADITRKSFERIESPIDENILHDFEVEMNRWATEMYEKLALHREEREAWPKNFASCVGRYGCCEYFDICDSGGDSWLDLMYVKDPRNAIDISTFADAKAEKASKIKAGMSTGTSTGADVSTPAEEMTPKKTKALAKKERVKELSALVLEATRQGLLSFELFYPSRYLVPNHTEKSVRAALMTALCSSWAEGVSWPVIVGAATYTVQVVVGGLRWSLENEPEFGFISGKLTWKSVVDALCKEWWNVSQLRGNVVKEDKNNGSEAMQRQDG